MPLTMTAKMDTWIRAQGCKRCKDTGRIECYRDADEDCPDCSPRRKLLAELDAERAAHQETQAKLELRTGCAKCKGLGFTERHQPGHTHYETEGECPAYHFEKVPCISCGTGTVANNKQLAETQAITRELLEALKPFAEDWITFPTNEGGLRLSGLSARNFKQAQRIYAKTKGVLPAGDTAGTGTR